MILVMPLQKKELSKAPCKKEENMKHGEKPNHREHRV